MKRMLQVALMGILVACSDSSTGPDPNAWDLEGDLVAGETAAVLGEDVGEQAEGVRIEGNELPISSAGSDEIRFEVPVLRDCEVDGRLVQVYVLTETGEERIRARMSVQDAIDMEVAETRALPPDDLECLQIPREGAWVVSYANLGFFTEHEDLGSLLYYGPRGDAEPTARGVASRSVGPFPLAEVDEEGRSLDPGAALDPVPPEDLDQAMAEEFGEPWDDYAGAEEGDTLEFVDWRQGAGPPTARNAETRDEVPTYEAEVVAIGGDHMIAVDLRLPAAEEVLTDANRDRLRRAAEIADDVLLEAIRNQIHPDLPIPPGAGGRSITMIDNLGGAGSAWSMEIRRDRKWNSGFFMYRIDIDARGLSSSSGRVARTIVHEAGHVAEVFLSEWFGLRGSTGWLLEAVAEGVADEGARLGRGAELGVQRTSDPNLINSSVMNNPSLRGLIESPWGEAGEDPWMRGSGNYTPGDAIWLYAQQLYDAEERHRLLRDLALRVSEVTGPNAGLRERAEEFSAKVIAEEFLEMPFETFLSEAILVDLTDGWVDPEAAEAQGLPQSVLWGEREDPSLENVSSAFRLDPGETVEMDLELPGGGYGAFYISSGSFDGSGLELEDHHEIRVTRLR